MGGGGNWEWTKERINAEFAESAEDAEKTRKRKKDPPSRGGQAQTARTLKTAGPSVSLRTKGAAPGPAQGLQPINSSGEENRKAPRPCTWGISDSLNHRLGELATKLKARQAR